jgi:hypothetical protein
MPTQLADVLRGWMAGVKVLKNHVLLLVVKAISNIGCLSFVDTRVEVEQSA